MHLQPAPLFADNQIIFLVLVLCVSNLLYCWQIKHLMDTLVPVHPAWMRYEELDYTYFKLLYIIA
jgi:hypothetical protein